MKCMEDQDESTNVIITVVWCVHHTVFINSQFSLQFPYDIQCWPRNKRNSHIDISRNIWLGNISIKKCDYCTRSPCYPAGFPQKMMIYLLFSARFRCRLISNNTSFRKLSLFSSYCWHCSKTCSILSMYCGVHLLSSSTTFSYFSWVCRCSKWLQLFQDISLGPTLGYPVKSLPDIQCA